MERTAKFIIGLVIFLVAVFGIGGYAYVQSREFLRGPQITVTSLRNGETFNEPTITVDGVAQNIAYISFNDAPIFVDSKGNFREKLLLLPGYNILTIKAEDRFGKKVEKTLELVYKEPPKQMPASSASVDM